MNYIIKNKQLPNICSFVAFVKEKQRIKRFEGAGAGLKRDCFVIWRPVDVAVTIRMLMKVTFLYHVASEYCVC